MLDCLPWHWTAQLTWLVVGFWLVPGALLRASPVILAVAWALAEDEACRSGNPLPVERCVALDILSMAAIACLTKLKFNPDTRRDWVVAAFFPFMLAVYATDWTNREKWLVLWALALAQFIIAGPWPFILRNRTWEGRRGLVWGAH